MPHSMHLRQQMTFGSPHFRPQYGPKANDDDYDDTSSITITNEWGVKNEKRRIAAQTSNLIVSRHVVWIAVHRHCQKQLRRQPSVAQRWRVAARRKRALRHERHFLWHHDWQTQIETLSRSSGTRKLSVGQRNVATTSSNAFHQFHRFNVELKCRKLLHNERSLFQRYYGDDIV